MSIPSITLSSGSEGPPTSIPHQHPEGTNAPFMAPSPHLRGAPRSPALFRSSTPMQSSFWTASTLGAFRPVSSSLSPPVITSAPPIVQPQSKRPSQGQGKRRVGGGFPTQPLGSDPDTASPSRKRKDRDPNWSREEILALVEAKKEEYMEELDVVDARDLMATDVSKWGRIAEKVNSATGGAVIREGPACKHKWQSTLSDYKRIADFHGITGTNGEEYFRLTFANRREQNLPRSFFLEVYHCMHELMMHRPSMNPLHKRDLLRPGDGYFEQHVHFESRSRIRNDGPQNTTTNTDDCFISQDSAPEDSISMDSQGDNMSNWRKEVGNTSLEPDGPQGIADMTPPSPGTTLLQDTNFNGFAPLHPPPTKKQSTGMDLSPKGCVASGFLKESPPVRGKSCNRGSQELHCNSTRSKGLSAGRDYSNPQVLSSSQSASEIRKLQGNTGHRKRTSPGHQLLATVTTESGNKMVQTLKEMTDANKEMEAKRIHSEWQIHGENMAYRKERDILQAEHMRQTLLHQGGFVSAIESLAAAITLSATGQASHAIPPLSNRLNSDPNSARTCNEAPMDAQPE